jgi:hypothetical protein
MCKSWRNDKWRDLLLTFWFWLAEGAAFVDVPMAAGAMLRVALPPMIFDAPFGIDAPDDGADDTGDEGGEDEPEDLDDNE